MNKYLLALSGFALLGSTCLEAQEISLFNGRDLTGWKGLADFWSVKDGVLTGSSTKKTPPGNTFLVWQGGELSDFDFSCKYRLLPDNPNEKANSGIQFRASLTNDQNFGMKGYQGELDPGTLRAKGVHLNGCLMDDPSGEMLAAANDRVAASFRQNEWNDYRIVATGNHIQIFVNGQVAVDTVESQNRYTSGLLGLQLHKWSAPNTVQFKDLKVRTLKGGAPNLAVVTAPVPTAAPTAAALPASQGQTPTAALNPGPVLSPLQMKQECFRYLLLARTAVNSITEEPKRSKAMASLALAHARAGDVAGARSITAIISVPAEKSRALASIAGLQARFGDVAGARGTAGSLLDLSGTDNALLAIAEAQSKAGDGAGAIATLGGISGPTGKVGALVLMAEMRAKAGDGAGFRQKIEEAKGIASTLTVQDEMASAYNKIAVAQTRVGDVASAKATAAEYKGHRYWNPIIAIAGAQAEAGDVAGANATCGEARCTMYPGCLAWRLIVDAQANAGKFTEAMANTRNISYEDHKLSAFASIEAKAGHIAEAKAAAEAILTVGHMDGDRTERYALAVTPIAAAQAKVEGFPAAERWVAAIGEALPRSGGYLALAEIRFSPTRQDYNGSSPARNGLAAATTPLARPAIPYPAPPLPPSTLVAIATPARIATPMPTPAPTPVRHDPAVGRWSVGGEIWEVRSNGTVNRSRPNFSEDGKWKRVSSSTPAKYEFNWSGGRVIDTVYLSSNGKKITRSDNRGGYETVGERAIVY